MTSSSSSTTVHSRNLKRVSFHPATVYHQRPGCGWRRRIAAKVSIGICLAVLACYSTHTDDRMIVLPSTRRQSEWNVVDGGAAVDMNAPVRTASQARHQRHQLKHLPTSVVNLEDTSTSNIPPSRIVKDGSQKMKSTPMLKRQPSSIARPSDQLVRPPLELGSPQDDDDITKNEESNKVQTKKYPLGFKTDISVLQYISCCGIGHRLARMSNAAHAAQRINYALAGVWPSCNKTNVYQHLFGVVEPNVESKHYTRTSHVLKVHNEVPGYETVFRGGRPIQRRGGGHNKRQLQRQQQQNKQHTAIYTTLDKTTNTTCNTCHPEKIASDYTFFQSLYLRYQKRKEVEHFLRDHHFANHTVVGMHIRAGNGEGGDFTNKGRAIDNTTQFVETVAQHIQSMVKSWPSTQDPPLLFIATDTPTMMDRFRDELRDSMPVIELKQRRPTEGQGILFGERGKRRPGVISNSMDNKEKDTTTVFAAKASTSAVEINPIDQCLAGWDAAYQDMMLLALSDVVIATRRSSFVQTIPLSLVTGKPVDQRKVASPYCEVSQDSHLTMTCHTTYMDWCCCATCAGNDPSAETSSAAEPMKLHQEYVKQPRVDLWDRPPLEWYKKKGKKIKVNRRKPLPDDGVRDSDGATKLKVVFDNGGEIQSVAHQPIQENQEEDEEEYAGVEESSKLKVVFGKGDSGKNQIQTIVQ